MVIVLGETATATGLATARVFALETEAPAPGFVTVTWICVPDADVEVPFKVICVVDCAVIVKAVLSSKATAAVGMKPVPVIVKTNGVAVFNPGRLKEVMDGTAFSSVTVADAILVGSAVLTASTVTIFTDGMVAGAL